MAGKWYNDFDSLMMSCQTESSDDLKMDFEREDISRTQEIHRRNVRATSQLNNRDEASKLTTVKSGKSLVKVAPLDPKPVANVKPNPSSNDSALRQMLIENQTTTAPVILMPPDMTNTGLKTILLPQGTLPLNTPQQLVLRLPNQQPSSPAATVSTTGNLLSVRTALPTKGLRGNIIRTQSNQQLQMQRNVANSQSLLLSPSNSNIKYTYARGRKPASSHTGVPIPSQEEMSKMLQIVNKSVDPVEIMAENVGKVCVDQYYYSTVRLKSRPMPPTELMIGLDLFCHVCQATLNNVTIVDHLLQKHIEKKNRYEGTNNSYVECPTCLRAVKRLHLNVHDNLHNAVVTKNACRICCVPFFNDQNKYLSHMRANHFAGEMPYKCPLCEYRSSFHINIIDHFSFNHKLWWSALCPFCLVALPINHNLVGRTPSEVIVQHLEAHLRAGTWMHCSKCTLSFLNKADLEKHVISAHDIHYHFTHIAKNLEVDPCVIDGEDIKNALYVDESDLLQHIRKPHITIVSNSQLTQNKPIHVEPAAPSTSTATVILAAPKAAPKKSPEKTSTQQPIVPPPSADGFYEVPFKKLGLIAHSKNHKVLTTTQGTEVICCECGEKVTEEHFIEIKPCFTCGFITNCRRSHRRHISNSCTAGSNLKRKSNDGITLTCKECSFSTEDGNKMANHLLQRPAHDFCKLVNDNKRVRK